MDLGIPEQDIAFAQDYTTDAQKGLFHRLIRTGKIRVGLGSTELMGCGMNAQNKLVAKHDLDAPWRPRDVEQRDGRIIRQLNENDTVRIYRYVKEGSFDAYMWQTLETKARFIAQVIGGDITVRTIEDATTQALSYAEIKALASGNPMVIEKTGIDAEVSKLWLIKCGWDTQQSNARSRASYAAADAKANRKQAQLLRDYAVSAVKNDMRIVVDGKAFSDGLDAAKAVTLAYKIALKRKERAGAISIAQYRGAEIYSHKWSGEACLEFVGQEMNLRGRDAQGWIEQIDRFCEDTLAWAQRCEAQARGREADIVEINALLAKPFEYEARLSAALLRQSEIDAALDLHSNEAGTGAMGDLPDATDANSEVSEAME